MTKVFKAVGLMVVLALVLSLVMVALPVMASSSDDEIESSWKDKTPKINGVFGDDEWEDATIVEFIYGGYAPSSTGLSGTSLSKTSVGNGDGAVAYAYIKNDEDYLYVAVDAVGDTTESMPDWVYICFDTENDDQVSDGHEDYFEISETNVHWVYYEGWGYDHHCSPFDTDLPLHEGLAGKMGFSDSPESSTDHRVYECRIPLDLILASPGDTVGYGMFVIDGGGMWSAGWPEGSYPGGVESYGELELAVEAEIRAAARVSASMGEAPHQVQFYDMSTGVIDTWYWSFGDGSYSDAQYPTHTYQNGGTYQICLTVEGPGGSDTACVQVIVEEGAGAPKLVVRNLYISATQAQPRQQVMVTADVFNEGTAWGDGDVELFINGQYEQTTGVGVSPGTAQPISFTVYKVTPGEYQVVIGNAMGTFHVVEEPQQSRVGGIPMDSGTLIALIVIGVFVIAALVVAIVVLKPQ